MAKVSKWFYRLSMDQNLFKQLEFNSREFTYDWMFLRGNWSEERTEKYYNDFFEVFRNAQKLKFLSVHLEEPPMGVTSTKYFTDFEASSSSLQNG